ncbi:MAG: hypothetical protein E6G56_04145 [Actinobacteria bacterium]|nr:MAG: hypothetical protein E6G56_04145 [Actinomycetota bacterium]
MSDPDNQTLVKADLDLLGAARTTSRILSDPQGVRKALQLLRALTVTQTLGVAPDQTVGGQLASNLFDQLDGILPGALTTGTGSAERLNAPVVRRFQRYARTKPILVEEPTVKQAVGQLTRILSGRPANLRVTLAGQQPAVTARQDLARDAQTTRPYWPQLSAQLSQLATRLR